jgi:hypothetical protein
VACIAGPIAACGFDGVASLSAVSGEAGAPSGGRDSAGEPVPLEASADGAPVETPIVDASVDVTPDATIAHPASCAELPAARANTDVTLYVGHDPAKAWAAHCGTGGKTYLPLPAGVATNYSSYPAGECASVAQGAEDEIKTTWTRVRIDPVSLIVETNDYTGAVSTGATREVSGNGAVVFTYDKIPFATGRICANGPMSVVVARVDLTGTKFRIADNQFIVEGFQVSGSAPATGRLTTLYVSGFPGGLHSCRPANTDYYQRNGGKCLQLQYVP